MGKHLVSALECAINAESKGLFEKALKLYKEALSESQQNPGPVLFEMGRFFFLQGMYEEALEVLVRCHRLGYRIDEVMDIIMQAYYEPNSGEFEDKYNQNISKLLQYKFINRKTFPDYKELSLWFIPYSESRFVIFDKSTGEFGHDFYINQAKPELNILKESDVVIINNEFNMDIILNCDEKTKNLKPFLTMKIPLYLYYDDFNEFVQYLQVIDLNKVLASGRIVFLFGKEETMEWFANPQSIFVDYVINRFEGNNVLNNLVSDIAQETDLEFELLKKKVNQYYQEREKIDFYESIKNGQPRILFITSRFTTALQFFIRDCVLACDKLGIPNRLIIEKSDLHRASENEWLSAINEFRPDVIFIIDHFKWEYKIVPNNIVFVSWVQDPLPNIMSSQSAVKIKEMDFVLNLFFNSQEFRQLGYPEGQLIDGPIPVNPEIYKKYDLTNEEFDKYQTDICLFSNAGNPQVGLDNLKKLLKEVPNSKLISEAFQRACEEAYQMTYEEKPLYTLEEYKELISKYFDKLGLVMSSDDLLKSAEAFRKEVGYRIMRSVPLIWLHEKGYQLKLWGKEWIDHPVLKQYAQGVAQNGETLSKIINASKVVIGTNPGISTHPRVFETILSNSLYLGVNIPEQHDWANIRKFMEEDKEIVFFYSKEDLYNKIDFYLNKVEKRREVIANGQKKILANLTFETMMKRVIGEIANRLEKQIKGGGGNDVVI